MAIFAVWWQHSQYKHDWEQRSLQTSDPANMYLTWKPSCCASPPLHSDYKGPMLHPHPIEIAKSWKYTIFGFIMPIIILFEIWELDWPQTPKLVCIDYDINLNWNICTNKTKIKKNIKTYWKWFFFWKLKHLI